jgi:hypothetical protein
MNTLNRRTFLNLAATAGCSLIVKVDGVAATPAGIAHDAALDPFDRIAPGAPSGSRVEGEPHMTLVDFECDVLVAGGGMAGVCAAVAAARNGSSVVLVQDRSRLGGNASSEVKMHIVGADHHGSRPGWREGGLIEEFRLEDAVNNSHRSFELWDLLLYDKVRSEPRITLLLDTVVYAVRMDGVVIRRVMARCDKTEHLYRITPRIAIDCTGDSRLALEAGAPFRVGRETRSEFNESLGLDQADRQTLGSSILFTSRDYGRPVPFRPPAWARKVTREQLQFRPVSSWEYGYWWIEWGGQIDTIRDNERIRHELLAIVLGVWDYIKNSGDQPTSANWGMDWIGMIPGKRGSRRIVGDHILTQNDLLGGDLEFDDAVAIGGWPMDDHPPSGFDRFEERPFTQMKTPEVYSIPLRALYSREVKNLMMAGRNISASHVAFTSSRVMATCSVIGQAAGTAAACCARHGLEPKQLYADKARLRELQQTLLRDDQTIKGLANQDARDLARLAKVTASTRYGLTRPENVINGLVRDRLGEWENCWAAAMDQAEDEPVWIQLTWDEPMPIREVQLTFDTGFQRELTLSASESVTRRMIRGPQPETVRDYAVYGIADDQERALVEVAGNYQRLRRHRFEPAERVRAIRLYLRSSNGVKIVRVYEVRCYG